MTICIVNPMNDIHCNYMILKLKEREIPYIELGPLEKNEYTFQNGKLFYNGTLIDFESISSVYIHGNMSFVPKNLNDSYIDTYDEQILFKAQIENLSTWLKILRDKGITLINPPVDSTKYYQLFRLIDAQIPMPQTCITNSYNELQNFVSKVGQVIFKPLTGGEHCREVNQFVLDSLRNQQTEPIIFQEYIKGQDIRVYLLNGEIISSHILENNTDYLDYRENPAFSTDKLKYIPVNLPEYVIKFCKDAANILNLSFTGIDIKIDEKGNYYLIECNSMPIYIDAEIKLKISITDKIIDALESSKSKNSTPIVLNNPTLHLKNNECKRESRLFDYKSIYLLNYQKNITKNPDVIVPLNEEQLEDIKKNKKYKGSKYMIVSLVNNELKVSGFI
ncbi:RimK family alpha-L-glutamate ligase [Lysinibacillus sp. NPDC095746]|uniref:ATP-grasp domain-containing protein n=1 Tax=Lysinibacillus sp. NPDC095746 TaxID=3364134 RepID=UPI0037F54A97